MLSQVEIQTGSRLHFGLLSYRPDMGRHFGGVGLMIDSPKFRITVIRSDRDTFTGAKPAITRARRFVELYRSASSKAVPSCSCHIEIHEFIPAHIGLGSGTQLAMAIAQSLAMIEGQGRESSPLEELAKTVRRGRRSALGLHGFQNGGFLVDAGQSRANGIGALAARSHFPEDWRLLIVTPHETEGLSGREEEAVFQQLPAMPAELTDRLCRIVLMELLPAVRDGDFSDCSNALHEFGSKVGEFFRPVQGGIYANKTISKLVDFLRKQGVMGVAQSSWGPTLCVLLDGQDMAEQLAADLAGDPRWASLECHVAAAMNTGALIHVEHVAR